VISITLEVIGVVPSLEQGLLLASVAADNGLESGFSAMP
jgi:hypothetical protein